MIENKDKLKDKKQRRIYQRSKWNTQNKGLKLVKNQYKKLKIKSISKN